MRFLFYSHDGVGLGHLRRHIAIAGALAGMVPEAKVLLATGVDEAPHLGLPPHIDTLKLPGLKKVANNQYEARRLGLASPEIRSLRSGLLKTAVETFRPAVVLVDKHPFGAGGEFRAALEAAKEQRARIVLGLRDILDEPEAVRREWDEHGLRDRIASYYDRVLVYGQRSIYDPLREYEFPEALAERSQFCGYVMNPARCAWRSDPCAQLRPAPAGPGKAVLATAGGGEDGYELLRAFLEASRGAEWRAVLVAGPLLAEEQFCELKRLAGARVEIHRFVPCLQEWFANFDALVCMGGYNTLVEAAFQGIPTVCIPRARPRCEQVLRARAFERLGLVRAIAPSELTAEALGLELAAALRRGRAPAAHLAPGRLQFDGAQRAAECLASLLPHSRPKARPVLAGP